jgi:hypothetical protein
MRWYEAAGIGVGIGIIYGTLLWFIKSQILFIYSQRIAFHTYYNPDYIAFSGATLASILCLVVILSHQPIYSFFETIAINWKKEEDDNE